MLVKSEPKYSKEQKTDCTSFRPTCTKSHAVRCFPTLHFLEPLVSDVLLNLQIF